MASNIDSLPPRELNFQHLDEEHIFLTLALVVDDLRLLIFHAKGQMVEKLFAMFPYSSGVIRRPITSSV